MGPRRAGGLTIGGCAHAILGRRGARGQGDSESPQGVNGTGSPYGAAGSLVVMTVWVYYASLIVLLGAEVTYLRSRRRVV